MREKTVQLNKKFFKSLLIILVCFILDRFSKIYIIDYFLKSEINEKYINSYLNFNLIWNRGIAFGLLQSEALTYHLISLMIFFVILFLFYILIKNENLLEIVCFSIIIGGAVGNLFDRIYYNAVPDFIDLHFNNFHWFTFNVSDICISIGIITLLIFDIFKYKNR